MAIQTGKTPMNIQGTSTREPAFGIPAVWISAEGVERAASPGSESGTVSSMRWARIRTWVADGEPTKVSFA